MRRQEVTGLSRAPPAGVCATDNTPQYDQAKMTMVRPIRSFNHRRSARDYLQGDALRPTRSFLPRSIERWLDLRRPDWRVCQNYCYC